MVVHLSGEHCKTKTLFFADSFSERPCTCTVISNLYLNLLEFSAKYALYCIYSSCNMSVYTLFTLCYAMIKVHINSVKSLLSETAAENDWYVYKCSNVP